MPQRVNEWVELKRFAWQAVLFLLPLGLLWVGLNLAADWAIDSQYERKYAEIAQPAVRARQIILGTSKAVRAINPAGLDSAEAMTYNFAFNGSRPTFYLPWYRLLLRAHYPPPQTILYAVDWFMFDETRLRRQFEQDSEFLPADVFWRALFDPNLNTGALLLNRFPLIKDKEALLLRLMPIAPSEYDYDRLSGYVRGYVPRQGATQLPDLSAPLHNSPAQETAFTALLDLLAADGVRVIFVHIPEDLNRITPDAQAVSYLHAIAAARNIPFLDYNRELAGDFNHTEAYFLDVFHMSEAGSAVFTAQLRQDLAGLQP